MDEENTFTGTVLDGTVYFKAKDVIDTLRLFVEDGVFTETETELLQQFFKDQEYAMALDEAGMPELIPSYMKHE